MKHRQKKYLSREMVLADIAKAHRQIEKCMSKAIQHEAAAELSKGIDLKDARENQEEVDRLWGKIERLQNTRLKRLQKTLAEFDTIPLGAASNVAGLCEQQVVLCNKE